MILALLPSPVLDFTSSFVTTVVRRRHHERGPVSDSVVYCCVENAHTQPKGSPRVDKSYSDVYCPSMRLSEGVEWSVHCCTILSLLAPGVTISGQRLAEYHDVPSAYLVKQLQKLSQGGIVETVKGRNGGYRLARPGNEVTLLDVVLAVEGKDRAFRCTEIRGKGPSRVAGLKYPKPCGIAAAMWVAEQAWRDELSRHTMSDLANHAAVETDPRQLEKALNWFQEVLS
jgi:Rrf2 family protein